MNTNPRANGCYCPSDCGCHRGRPLCGCIAHNGYRLTDHDERHARQGARAQLEAWHRQHVTYNGAYQQMAERRAMGAIGCTRYDLRDTEVDWIEAMVTSEARDVFGALEVRKALEVAR